MGHLSVADALHLAINVLRDSAESRKMPCGIELDTTISALHMEAAEVLAESLQQLRDHE